MKKTCVLYALFVLIVVGCDFTNMNVRDRNSLDSIQVVRYDRVQARYLTTGDFAALQEMNTAYPTMTRALIENLLQIGEVNNYNINKLLLNFYQDQTLQDVIFAAESEFADMDDVNEALRRSFGALKKEVPTINIPRFYAQIGAFRQSIIVDDDAIGISLDKYLGKDYTHYKRFYDKEQRQTMTRNFIAPDCMVFFLLSKYTLPDSSMPIQHIHDMHVALIMWTTNKLVGRHVFHSHYIDRVGKYMQNHKEVTIEQLLNTSDYSVF